MSESSPESGVTFETRGNIVVARILNAWVLEPESVERFGDTIVYHLETNPEISALLCFDDVDYMSSSTVTQLVRIKDTCDRLGTRMALCGLRPEIMRIFEITNLVEHLHAMDEQDMEAAFARFKRQIQRDAEDSAWNA